MNSPNLPDDFPDSFAFSKDIDIICVEEEFESLVQKTIAYFEEKCKGYYDNLAIKNEEARCRVRIEMSGYLVFQIDIQYKITGVNDIFIGESLERRKKLDNYYVPTLSDELCYRVNELVHYPNKKHHREYLEMYNKYINVGLVKKNIECSEEILKWRT